MDGPATSLPVSDTALTAPEVSNLLLLVPPIHPGDVTGCMELLTVTDPGQTNVWSLGIAVSPDQRVENWEEYVSEKPAAFKIISVGEHPESRAKQTAAAYGFEPDPHFETIPDAGALTRIGVTLTNALEEWTSTDRQTVVCFHSVSALLQYTSHQQAYRFLNTFTSHTTSANTVAHYHLDPTVHEDATIARLSSLFDRILALDSADEWKLATHTDFGKTET